MALELLLSCEHATSYVPPAYQQLFGKGHVLATHRGVDKGALALARFLTRASGAPLFATQVSRLLVEANRSLRGGKVLHPRLPPQEGQALLQRYYFSHRQALTAHLESALLRRVCIVHVGVHSFTPVWKGRRRRCDVGLLFDPSRGLEARFCRIWQAHLAAGGLVVRRNYPYRGTSDGLTTTLRQRFAPTSYLGIELEVNQARVVAGGRVWHLLQRHIAESLMKSMTQLAEPICQVSSPDPCSS